MVDQASICALVIFLCLVAGMFKIRYPEIRIGYRGLGKLRGYRVENRMYLGDSDAHGLRVDMVLAYFEYQ